jgi:hypothetical protein
MDCISGKAAHQVADAAIGRGKKVCDMFIRVKVFQSVWDELGAIKPSGLIGGRLNHIAAISDASLSTRLWRLLVVNAKLPCSQS